MTDPPYNIPIDGFVGGKGSVRHREFAQASGEMSDAEFLAFLAGFFTTAMATLIPGALVYAWMDWRHIDTLIAALAAHETVDRHVVRRIGHHHPDGVFAPKARQ